MGRRLKVVLLIFALSVSSAYGVEGFQTQEKKDRSVDRAAISAYKAAANRLARLLPQKKNTKEEPALLFRLAETYYKAAAIEYRLAHGGIAAGRSADLTEYRKTIGEVIAPLTRMIEAYPKHRDIPTGYFRRAKAYREVGRTDLAIADLRFLVDHVPALPERSSIYITLHDFLVEAKDYRQAMVYLTRLNAQPKDDYFTLVQEKLAWDSYLLNDLDGALRYIERELAVDRTRKARSRAQLAERETAISNIALFYATGVEGKRSGFSAEKALDYFRTLRLGSDIGKVAISFAFLLRTKGMDAELGVFKDRFFASELPAQDKGELLLVVAGHELNKRNYAQLAESLHQLGRLWDAHSELREDTRLVGRIAKGLAELSESLLTTFGKLQAEEQAKAIPAEKSAIPPIAQALTLAIETSMKTAAETGDKAADESRLQKAHYNLAEIGFRLGDFKKATEHYRWLVDEGKAGSALVEEARLKAIGARYEFLRAQKLIPGELTARSFKKAEKRDLYREIVEWNRWVDEAFERKSEKQGAALEVFVFEANRLLYSFGHLEEALERLIDFTHRVPASKYAIPSAALAMDTYLASEEWETAFKLATEFLQVPQWKGADFHGKLNSIAGDTSYKLIEKVYREGNYKEVIERAKAYLAAYPKGRYVGDCQVTAANAALGLKDKKTALAFFSPVLSQGGRPEVLGQALLTNASVAEEGYDFAAAAAAYRRYLALPVGPAGISGTERQALQRKTVTLAWLSGDRALLRATLADDTACAGETLDDCSKYQALDVLRDRIKPGPAAAQGALAALRRSKPASRPYWAAVALLHTAALSPKDRSALLLEVVSAWPRMDGLTRMALMPKLSAALIESMRLARDRIRKVGGLRADPASIKRRTKLIEELETQTEKLAGIGLARVVAAATNESASAYADFAKDMGALPMIPGLSPEDRKAYKETIDGIRSSFKEKAVELRKKAFEFAADSGVEADVLNGIAQAYFAEAPEQARELGKERAAVSGTFLSAALLDRVQQGQELTEPAKAFKAQFERSIKDSNPPRAAYLLLEAKAKGEIGEAEHGVATAITLQAAGAQAEGLAELERALSKLDKDARSPALVVLLTHFFTSYSKAKLPALLSQLDDLDPALEQGTEKELAMVTQAAAWVGSPLAPQFKERLARRVPAEHPEGAKQ